jgi:lanosterol synthase
MSMPASHREKSAPVSPQRALAALQRIDGSWEGEVIWNPMITAQIAIARTLVGRPGRDTWKAGVRRHFHATQNEDGGWGMHPVATSCLFMTVLVYVAARLLGEPEDGALATRARTWIHNHPQGLYTLPSWGKLWLAFMRLYPYEAINPVAPEFFLLPNWLPINADKMYCHTRHIYLGLAFLYGHRFSVDLGELARALRRELYSVSFNHQEAIRQRHTVANSDLYEAPPRVVRLLYTCLRHFDVAGHRYRMTQQLRERALEHCMDLIQGEIESSHGWCLSAVCGVLYVVSLYAHDPADPQIDTVLNALETWRWEDEQRGIRYAGARSPVWDTAFALRALLAHAAGATGNPPSVSYAIRHGYAYLASQQCTEDHVHRNRDRQDTYGGWCFGDKQHGWPVSDCTAEAVSALLACHDIPGLIPDEARIGNQHLIDAAHFMLNRQNADGGFSTYERNSAPRFLENTNPSEMFGKCMTELSYIECTASCVEALAGIRSYLALDQAMNHRVERALAHGIRFLRKSQQSDGSYAGFWGIHYIYATSFVLRGLSAAGLPGNDPTVRRALTWMRSKQRPDGGWGEHYSGCLQHRYVENDASLIISTSWALLGLAAFIGPADECIRRGAAWLATRRNDSSLWPREKVNGAFFESAMLEYCLYNSIFPTWALACSRPQ